MHTHTHIDYIYETSMRERTVKFFVNCLCNFRSVRSEICPVIQEANITGKTSLQVRDLWDLRLNLDPWITEHISLNFTASLPLWTGQDVELQKPTG